MTRHTHITLALCLALSAASGPAAAGTFLAFTPDSTLETAPAAGGCHAEAGLARGLLTGSSTASACHSGQWGAASPTVFAGDAETDGGQATALFTSAPLPEGLAVGGQAHIVLYYQTTNQNNYAIVDQTPTQAHVEYALHEVASSGDVITIVSGQLFEIPGLDVYLSVERGTGSFQVPAHALAAGSRLRVSLTSTAAPDGRVLFGGPDYGDSGIWLGGDGGGGAGALPVALLAALLGLAGLRRRIGASRHRVRPAPLRHHGFLRQFMTR
jgi:hypothetical protein